MNFHLDPLPPCNPLSVDVTCNFLVAIQIFHSDKCWNILFSFSAPNVNPYTAYFWGTKTKDSCFGAPNVNPYTANFWGTKTKNWSFGAPNANPYTAYFFRYQKWKLKFLCPKRQPLYSTGTKSWIFCFALLLPQILVNFQNQGQI